VALTEGRKELGIVYQKNGKPRRYKNDEDGEALDIKIDPSSSDPKLI